MNKALVLLFLFFVGSLLGWVIELFFRRFCSPKGRTTKKWVNPGFLVGPYLPLYGSGLCVLYLLASINLSFLDEHPIIEKIVLFVFMAIAMTVIEYITGLIFIKGMNVKLWDYTDRWGNIQGIICPLFSFFWAVLGAIYYLLIPLTFGMIAVSSNFVPWFFGSGYDKVVSLLGILSFLILAIGINNVTGIQYLIPTKRENIFTATVIVGAAINFILNFFLIQTFQSMGAAIASVVAEMTIAIIQIYIIRKEIPPFEIVKCGVHYFIAGGIMFTVLMLIRNFFSPSIIHTLELVVIGGSIYGVMLLIMKDDFVLSNINKILKKFSRNLDAEKGEN